MRKIKPAKGDKGLVKLATIKEMENEATCKSFDGRTRFALGMFELLRRDVSATGARQFLNSEIVLGLSDRRKLVQIISQEFGLTAGDIVPLPLFLPAIQKIWDIEKKSGACLSAVGAHQFLAGLPINNRSDRQCLTEFFYDSINPLASLNATKNMALKGKKILQN